MWTEAEKAQHEQIMKFLDMSPKVKNQGVQVAGGGQSVEGAHPVATGSVADESVTAEQSRGHELAQEVLMNVYEKVLHAAQKVEVLGNVMFTPLTASSESLSVVVSPALVTIEEEEAPKLGVLRGSASRLFDDSRWKKTDRKLGFNTCAVTAIERKPRRWFFKWMMTCFS